jgi:hypothetical protein
VGFAAAQPTLHAFSWFQGVPKGREKLSRKVRRGWKPLLQIPGLFSWFQGVPKGREKLLRKVLSREDAKRGNTFASGKGAGNLRKIVRCEKLYKEFFSKAVAYFRIITI